MIQIVHNVYKTRDMPCIPRVPVRHEPDVVCVQITSDRPVRETVHSRDNMAAEPRIRPHNTSAKGAGLRVEENDLDKVFSTLWPCKAYCIAENQITHMHHALRTYCGC